MKPQPEQALGRIFTFFSFKGGVGRTLALANVGFLLASYGRSVLLVDGDLEAPGLSMFLLPTRHTGQQGFVELFLKIRELFVRRALAKPGERVGSEVNIDDYRVPLDLPRELLTSPVGEPGQLWLMPAGAMDADYVTRLTELRIGETYQAGYGVPLAWEVRRQFQNAGFNYILIDSRTGYSDVSGALLVDVSDRGVVVTGLNRQNLEGTRRYLDEIGFLHPSKPSDPRRFFLVASPVPREEVGLREDRLRVLTEALGRPPDVKLTYHPRLAMTEELFVVSQPDDELSRGYRALGALILDSAEDGIQAHFRAAGEALRGQDLSSLVREIELVARQDHEQALAYLRTVSDFLTQAHVLVGGTEKLYGMICALEPRDHIALYNWGNDLSSRAARIWQTDPVSARDLLDEAAAKYARATELKPDKHEAFYNWGNDLATLATRTWETDRVAARRLFDEAFDKYARAIEIRPDLHWAFNNWGSHLAVLAARTWNINPAAARQLFDEAFAKYARATEIKPDLHESFNNWGGHLATLATRTWQIDPAAARQLFEEAFTKYARATEIKPDFHEAFNNWGYALRDLADFTYRSDPKAARLLLRESCAKYSRAIETRPDFAYAYNNWGIALSDLATSIWRDDPAAAWQLFDEGFAKYSRATELKPDYHEAFYNWGNGLRGVASLSWESDRAAARRLFEEAFAKYARTTQIKPNYHEAFNNWANALSTLATLTWQTDRAAARRLFEEAFAKYARASEIKPDDHEPLYNWGNVLARLATLAWDTNAAEARRLFDEAFAMYSRTIRIKPDDYQAMNNWATGLFLLGRMMRKAGSIEEANRLGREGAAKVEGVMAIRQRGEHFPLTSPLPLVEVAAEIGSPELIDQARRFASMAVESSMSPLTVFALAVAMFLSGDRRSGEEIIRKLEPSADPEEWLYPLLADPFLSPRFRELIESVLPGIQPAMPRQPATAQGEVIPEQPFNSLIEKPSGSVGAMVA